MSTLFVFKYKTYSVCSHFMVPTENRPRCMVLFRWTRISFSTSFFYIDALPDNPHVPPSGCFKKTHCHVFIYFKNMTLVHVWTEGPYNQIMRSLNNIVSKSSAPFYLCNNTRGLLFWREINKTQEDVLQLDEERIRVHSPVLPCPETCHHPLLQQKDKNYNMESVMMRATRSITAHAEDCYLKVLTLKMSLDCFVCGIEVWENLAELCLKTIENKDKIIERLMINVIKQ